MLTLHVGAEVYHHKYQYLKINFLRKHSLKMILKYQH